jgi:hypothetical protein
MARDEEMERRLQNWARWKLGASAGGLGYGRCNWNMEPSGTRYREATIPTNDCEASITDQAVASLEDRLRQTIEQVYLTGDSAAIDARKLGCSEATVKARVWEAHRRMVTWFADRAAVARQERERVEVLQRAAKGSSTH